MIWALGKTGEASAVPHAIERAEHPSANVRAAVCGALGKLGGEQCRIVLEKLLPEAGHKSPRCQYVHLLREVTDAAAAGACQLAVLVPPATMTHVAHIAGNLEKMPPKSTYFYPKLLSGLVFHSLKTQ